MWGRGLAYASSWREPKSHGASQESMTGDHHRTRGSHVCVHTRAHARMYIAHLSQQVATICRIQPIVGALASLGVLFYYWYAGIRKVFFG